MIKRVGDGKCGPVQAKRLAARRGLQHVLGRQRGCGPVTQGKRVLQELDDLGFGLQVRGTIAAGVGPASGEIVVVVGSPVQAPGIPSGLIASAAGSSAGSASSSAACA